MFSGCSSLSNSNLSYFNTNNITDMSFMFDGCSSLKNLNLSTLIHETILEIFQNVKMNFEKFADRNADAKLL